VPRGSTSNAAPQPRSGRRNGWWRWWRTRAARRSTRSRSASLSGPARGSQAPLAFLKVNRFLCGIFVWVRRAFNGPFRWFPAREVRERRRAPR
jgi:hypothetical protein